MYVTEVIPLRRGIGIERLSYYGSDAYAIGTLVSIPVRNQLILGLVHSVAPVSAAKTALRAATFSLKKLPEQNAPRTLSPAYVRTAEHLAKLYASTTGSILFNLLPPEIQRGEILLPHALETTNTSGPAPELLHAKKSERYSTYRTIVRAVFARNGSVIMVAPTSSEARELYASLALGIEDRIILLTGTQGKRELRTAFTCLEDFTHAHLIITTPSYAMIERHDVTHVIIEDARSPHYRERVRPYLDYRDVLRIHAKETGRTLILGDLLPRTEDEYLRRTDIYSTYGQTPKRIELPGNFEVIHREETHAPGSTFSLFDPGIEARIREVQKKKKHIFLFSARRGLAPVVACQNCGYIFRSPTTGAPYSLIRTTRKGVEERWFVCGTSGERVRAADICPHCNSWKLRERGIGIQFVQDTLKKMIKDTPLILFDHTTATTYKKAQFLRDTFYETKGALMLGTHMAIPYLTEPLDDSIVISMDALLTTPTWRLDEENLALLLRLREITTDTVYVQSRTKEHDLFTYAKHAEVERFYTDEIAVREACQYPPFVHFIHLTWQGTREAVKALEEVVKTTLAPFTPSCYAHPQSPEREPIMYALIRVPTNAWPNDQLERLLKSLPPSIRIMHNPDRII